MRGRLVALGLVWGCLGIGTVAACGGDDDGGGSSSGAPDASTDTSATDTSATDASSNAPNIVANSLTIYTGMTAALDASGTAAESFTWVLKSAPPGSTVSTATLGGATTARPTFRADVSGDYVLNLTVKNGDASANKDITVKAVPAPVMYMQTNFSEKPPYYEYRTIGTDGTGGHPVACRTNGVADAGVDGGDDPNGSFLFISMLLADMGEDWWEAPPGEPSRLAFVAMDINPDGGPSAASLNLGTTQSTCQAPPKKLGGVGEDGGAPKEGMTLLQPRFNRAGSRVAYLEERESGWYIASVSYDGNDRRDLGRMCPPDSNGSDCYRPAFFPQRPQWLDDQTVGWARNTIPDGGGEPTGWEVVVATDGANPNPRLYMTCDGFAPRSIAFLKDGSVIANRQAPDAGAREDLWLLKPSAPGGPCTVIRNLTNLPTDRSYARDFSVSPDDSEVAFVRAVQQPDAGQDGGGTRFGGEVFIAPVSGAATPAPLTGTPQAAFFGPRYVAGASLIAWNGAVPNDGGANPTDDAGILDGGVPVIAIAARNGAGGVTYAAKSDVQAGTYLFGGGNGGACDFRLDLGCNLGSRRASGSALAMGLVATAFLLRRRRRER